MGLAVKGDVSIVGYILIENSLKNQLNQTVPVAKQKKYAFSKTKRESC